MSDDEYVTPTSYPDNQGGLPPENLLEAFFGPPDEDGLTIVDKINRIYSVVWGSIAPERRRLLEGDTHGEPETPMG